MNSDIKAAFDAYIRHECDRLPSCKAAVTASLVHMAYSIACAAELNAKAAALHAAAATRWLAYAGARRAAEMAGTMSEGGSDAVQWPYVLDEDEVDEDEARWS